MSRPVAFLGVFDRITPMLVGLAAGIMFSHGEIATFILLVTGACFGAARRIYTVKETGAR